MFEKIETYLRDIGACNGLDDMRVVLQRQVRAYGFDMFTYWLRWPSSEAHEPIFISTYPAQFVQHYIDSQFQSHDMVGRISLEVNTPFQWSDIERVYPITKMQQMIFDDSQSVGLMSGGSIPIHGPRQIQATFSVASDLSIKQFNETFFAVRHELHILATYAHERILQLGLYDSKQELCLTPRETEVLTWVARGKTYWEIGMILGVQEDTVKKFMKRIFSVLNASNNTHAVAKAIIHGLIIP